MGPLEKSRALSSLAPGRDSLGDTRRAVRTQIREPARPPEVVRGNGTTLSVPVPARSRTRRREYYSSSGTSGRNPSRSEAGTSTSLSKEAVPMPRLRCLGAGSSEAGGGQTFLRVYEHHRVVAGSLSLVPASRRARSRSASPQTCPPCSVRCRLSKPGSFILVFACDEKAEEFVCEAFHN